MTDSRTRGLVAAVLTLLLAVGATAFWLYRSGGHRVGLEVVTRSGAVARIQWSAGGEQDAAGGTIPTPWSHGVTTTRLGGPVTLTALSSEDDLVTCRISIDGTTLAESTAKRVSGCTAHLR